MIKITAATGNKAVFEDLKEIQSKHSKAINRTLKDYGKRHVTYIKELIRNPPKTGRIYRFRGRPHQASAPGEAPANRSGRLLRSVNYVVRGASQLEFGDRIYYGEYLELGTRNPDGSTRIAPRPHVSRAVNKLSLQTAKALERHFKK